MYFGNSKKHLISQKGEYSLVYDEYQEQYQILLSDGWEFISISDTGGIVARPIAEMILGAL